MREDTEWRAYFRRLIATDEFDAAYTHRTVRIIRVVSLHERADFFLRLGEEQAFMPGLGLEEFVQGLSGRSCVSISLDENRLLFTWCGG